MAADYLGGAFVPKDDLTLPYIWVSLHLNAQMEQDILANPRLSRETARVTDEIGYLLLALKEVSAMKWWSLCEASGWTVFGAVGVSWCKDATPEAFWAAWELASYPLSQGLASERPCTFINRAFLPETNVLTEIIRDCDNLSN